MDLQSFEDQANATARDSPEIKSMAEDVSGIVIHHYLQLRDAGLSPQAAASTIIGFTSATLIEAIAEIEKDEDNAP